MRKFGSIPTNFWEIPEIRQLSDQAKLMASYLMTGPHSNMLGCYRLPAIYVTEDLAWSIEKVNDTFKELIDINFITRDEKLSWLVIHGFLKDNKIQNSKQAISIQKIFYNVPQQSTVVNALINELLIYGKYLKSEFVQALSGYGIDTPSAVVSIEQEQEQEKKQYQDQKQEKEIARGYASAISGGVFSLKDNKILKTQNAYYAQAVEILSFLNEKCRKVFEPTPENLDPILYRLETGEQPDICRAVIVRKADQWNDVKKMVPNLNPETLFGDKFSRYKGELVLPEEGDEDEA